MTRHPIWDALDAAQMDLRNAQARLVSIRSFAAGLNLAEDAPTMSRCPHCGPIPGGERLLAEHIHNVHDGPEPAHWAAEDRRLADAERSTPA